MVKPHRQNKINPKDYNPHTIMCSESDKQNILKTFPDLDPDTIETYKTADEIDEETGQK